MTSKTITVILSDTHIGGTTSLALPSYTDLEGRKICASSPQGWLWNNWLDLQEYVKSLAGIRGKSRKNRVVLLHLGDIVDGVHHNSTQLLPDVEDQILMACELLRSWQYLADGGIFITFGTPSHAGIMAANEYRIGKEIGARRQEYHLSLNIDGMVLDCAHHGASGRQDWTSSASRTASKVMLRYAKAGKPPPRYVLRGHNHIIDDSGERIQGTRSISCPSWQLATEYAWKFPDQRADIGAIILNGSEVDFSKARYSATDTLNEVTI